MAARKKSTTRKPRTATKKKRGGDTEDGADQHEAISVFELSEEEEESAEAVPALTRLLGDTDWQVRSKAAWALGQIGDRRAADALASALKDSKPDVRKTAAWALGQIGEERD